MIHVSFKPKEVAGRVGAIDDLAKLARALKEANAGSVMVYFEFDTGDDLLYFCKAIGMIQTMKDVDKLEEYKKQLQLEVKDKEAKGKKKKQDDNLDPMVSI